MAITATAGYQAYALFMPDSDVHEIQASDGLRPRGDVRVWPVFRDAVLQACLLRLATAGPRRYVSEDIGDDRAARQIVIRLCVIVGGETPDWHKDRSVFTPGVMRQVVEPATGAIVHAFTSGTMVQIFQLEPHGVATHVSAGLPAEQGGGPS